MDLTSKRKLDPEPKSMTLQSAISYFTEPRVSSGNNGLTKGYLVVAGFVKMWDTARLNIGDMRDLRDFFDICYITNG